MADGTISRRFQRREQKFSVFSSNESFVVSNLEFQELSVNLEIVLSYLFLVSDMDYSTIRCSI